MAGKYSQSISNLFRKLSVTQKSQLEQLSEEFKGIIQTDAKTLKDYQRDTWAFSEIEDFQGKNNPLPLAVVKPETTEQISKLLKYCNENNVAVVPYGAGSGVCGAIKAEKNTLILSLEKLDGLIELNEDDMIASFWAGTNGKVAEDAVQNHGLTIGHWPQSIDISSVGGWVAIGHNQLTFHRLVDGLQLRHQDSTLLPMVISRI
jgi:FAD/FMN-containing dehydrogenase